MSNGNHPAVSLRPMQVPARLTAQSIASLILAMGMSLAKGLCSSRPLALSGSPSRCAPGSLRRTAPVGRGLPGARSALSQKRGPFGVA